MGGVISRFAVDVDWVVGRCCVSSCSYMYIALQIAQQRSTPAVICPWCTSQDGVTVIHSRVNDGVASESESSDRPIRRTDMELGHIL